MNAPPEPLLLREHSLATAVSLAEHEIRTLRGSDAGLTIIATGSHGVYDIQSSHYVGTIVTRERRIVIRPKIGMQRVLYLLGYGVEAFRYGLPTQLEASEDLLEVMQALFAAALGRATERGLVWDYRDHYDALASPRGRIDLRALITRRFGMFPPIDCTFDDFTADSEANRRLLGAATLLTRGALGLTRAGRQLHRTMGRFQGVSLQSALAMRPAPLHLGRRWDRFRPALGLAHIILSCASVELAHGHVDSIGFLVNMNDCFEKFVVHALRDALFLNDHTWAYHPRGLALADDGRLSVKPDVVWYAADGHPLLVLDAKYKITSNGNVNDVFQLISYCLAIGLSRGVLVYGDAISDVHRIPNPGIDVYVEALSPDGTVEEIEARINNLAARLRKIVAETE